MVLEFVFKNLYVEWLVFEWLVANEFFSNKKICLHYISIFLSIFCITCFSAKEVFNTSSQTKIDSIKLSRNGHQKVFFFDSLDKYLVLSAGLWSSVCVVSWIFENVFENFRIVYKKTDKWYIEWRRVATCDNEWSKVRSVNIK